MGAVKRLEFGARVKKQAYARAAGKCEKCAMPLQVGRYHFDHVKPAGLGGSATLSNCAVLCTLCHRLKTKVEDMPVMNAADRQKAAHLGQTKPKAKIPSAPKAPKKPEKPRLPPRQIYKDE